MISRFEEMVRTGSREASSRWTATLERDCVRSTTTIMLQPLIPQTVASTPSSPRTQCFGTSKRSRQAERRPQELSESVCFNHPLQGRRYSFILIEDDSPSLPSELRATLESRFGLQRRWDCGSGLA
jgi:hypothetical protein